METKEAVLIIGILSSVAGVISLDYWDDNQVRVMYQQAYAKNQECRISMKDSTVSYIDKVCGDIPQLKEYQK